MKRLALLFIAALALAMRPSITQASDKNVGTSSAQFLKIGAGARPTGMGDSFVAVDGDVNAVYFNPAGIANINQPEFVAMHTQWFADIGYDFGAFSYPTDHGALAISAATLKVADIQRRNLDESENGSFGAMDSTYALSYAHNLSSRLSLGATARYIKQSIDSTSASTWAGDVGVLRRFKSSPYTVGVAIKNMGKPMEFRHESDPLPLTVDAGVSASYFRQKLTLSADGRWRRDNSPAFGLGTEYMYPLGRQSRLLLRTGYSSAITDAGASGLTFGGGLGFGRADFDFAWVPFSDLGNTFRYSLRVRFN